jgi:ribA/ribD-fused uncharacterized protein
MDNCSFFIKNKAYFGSYPSKESVEELQNNGVRYFVDLTCDGEKNIDKYTTKYTYINYPIVDRSIPTDIFNFSKFIIKISNIIKNLKSDTYVYLHCKGGHGRAGITVACLLCNLYKFTPEYSLELTTKYHSKRKNMREKWRKIGSPQTRQQKNFVIKFFEPLYFYKAYKTGPTVGFSNFSYHKVKTELGEFNTSEAAFQCYKDPDNKQYIEKQKNTQTPINSRKLGRQCNLRNDWETVKLEYMVHVLRLKVNQHDIIKQNLINTGLRPIIEHNKLDNFWGSGHDGNGKNYLGKILCKIRLELFNNLL